MASALIRDLSVGVFSELEDYATIYRGWFSCGIINGRMGEGYGREKIIEHSHFAASRIGDRQYDCDHVSCSDCRKLLIPGRIYPTIKGEWKGLYNIPLKSTISM